MSESKESKEELAPIVRLVAEFCRSSHFEEEFEVFAREHFEVFQDAAEMKDASEHRLEFYDIYNEYLHKFEAKIENFLRDVRDF
jgi:hypothetical protein